MTVAFLSDIHANFPALQAALRMIDQQGVQQVVVVGDIVGDGPYPREVVQQLLDLGAEAVRGNADRKILELGPKGKRLKEKLRERLKGSGAKRRNRAWTALQLLDEGEPRAWLESLPSERLIEFDGHSTLVVHGSPLGDTDAIYPSITEEGLRSKLERLGESRPAVLVSGHSHVPFAREFDGVLVVNCGSVGRPVDGDPRGSFALVDYAAPEGPRCEIVRFAYPVIEVLIDLQARRVPGINSRDYELGIRS